ncbi:MAG: hypothetical protein MUF54_11375 [Polyangiaceae bacterium]|jgi:hypothetical protein|nr:hypothetical protein [Polyangiaceae bacterium]
MPTKAVTNRQKDTQAIVAAADTHALAIAETLSSLIKPHLKRGEQTPDFGLVITVLARLLTARDATMVAADEAHELELGDDTASRNARDASTAALGKHLVDLREVLVGMFGSTIVRTLGFSGTVPRDPVVLLRYAGEIAAAIRNAPPVKPRIKGAEWNQADVAAQIDELRAAIERALHDVARELREAQGTLEAKNKAIAARDATCAGVAEMLGGLLRVAGNWELAEKLRPVVRRATETPGEPEEPQSPAEAGGTPTG